MSHTRVDFYILKTEVVEKAWHFACRLTEKAYRQKQRLFIYCQDQHEAHRFDQTLWTFEDISFVPHVLQGEVYSGQPPIHIGYEAPDRAFPCILNLSTLALSFNPSPRRVLELVYGNERDREQAREKFKAYRALACEIFTHQIDI